MFTHEEIATIMKIMDGKTAMDWMMLQTEINQQFDVDARAVVFTKKNAQEAARLIALRTNMYADSVSAAQTTKQTSMEF